MDSYASLRAIVLSVLGLFFSFAEIRELVVFADTAARGRRAELSRLENRTTSRTRISVADGSVVVRWNRLISSGERRRR